MESKEFKILSIGTDVNTLDKNSRIAKRIMGYGDLVDKYTVVVPARENKKIVLSDKVTVFGVMGKNKICQLFRVYFQAKSVLGQEKYTIITVQDQYYLGFIAWLLARKFKIGLEIQNHGFEKFYGLRKLIAKFIFPRASSVRTMSNRLKNRLIEEFGVREERITIVPVFFKPSDDYLKTERVVDDRFIFLTVGRLVPVKNIAMQIRAMKNIVDNNKNIELWILGQGPLGNELYDLVKDLGIEKNIKFLGWRDNVLSIYRQANAFLLTSMSEGWPISVLEAAGCALPIIMTDVGSAGELIVNNKNGIVIPVNDQEALENSMKLLFDDKELCLRLGESARRSILNMPSKEDVLKMHKESFMKARI